MSGRTTERERERNIVEASARHALAVHSDPSSASLTEYGIASCAASMSLVMASTSHPNHAMTMERALRAVAAEHGMTVEFVDMGEPRPGAAPYRHRLAVGSDEHPRAAGIAWRDDDERDDAIHWAISAVLAWKRVPA